jgi:hypothetical protein
MENLVDIITHPHLVSWYGAICGHILSLYSEGFAGCQPFLRKIFPNKTDAFYVRVDFLLLPFIGTLLSIVLLEPDDVKSALVSGLSWSGALMALLNNKNNK